MVGGCVVLPGRLNCGETMTTGARASKPRALAVRRHHLLVRISHWLTIPLLLGLILSGISIYWASPIYQHDPNPTTGSFDYFADAGIWICAHLPWLHHYADPANWVYNHGSLGPYMLAFALRFHWLCAYLLMLNGLMYLAGRCIGGGLRAVPSGWAIHKPAQLSWLTAIFGGFDQTRVWHFWLMVFFIVFVIPHVVLVIADGWDTLRSMITGWSTKFKRSEGSDHEL